MICENLDSEHHIHLQGELMCGAWVEIIQREPGMIVEISVIPHSKIEDTAWIKDGKLKVNMTVESAVGLYALLNLALVPPQKKSKGLPNYFTFLFGGVMMYAAHNWTHSWPAAVLISILPTFLFWVGSAPKTRRKS